MITLVFIIYFCTKSFIISYLILNYILSIIVYYKASKYYFPVMRFNKQGLEKFNSNTANTNKFETNKLQYIHENYPSFNRGELNSISLAWIFFGMINYFWIKAICSVILTFIIWLRMRIHFIGRDISSKLTFQDKQTISGILSFYVRILWRTCGVWVNERDVSSDENVLNVYKKYLGENYNQDKSLKNKFTTIISNHVSWMDILYHLAKDSSSFISKATVKNVPMIGFISQGVQSLFIDRSSKDSRNEIMSQISERQKEVNEGKSFFPVVIYPEGTTSNGRSLITFKKGAFFTLNPIKIYLIKIDNAQGSFSLSTSSMSYLLHVIITWTKLKVNYEVLELPIFTPTEFLFQNFKHLGKDQSEIYTEACRHLMSEISGFPISNSSYDTKLNYITEIKRKVVKNT